MAQTDAKGGDLVVPLGILISAPDPDPDPFPLSFPGDPKIGKGADKPVLERDHEAAHVSAAPVEIQHHIGDPLTGTVVSVLAAAASAMDRKTMRIEKILHVGTGTRAVQGRMFEKPHSFGLRSPYGFLRQWFPCGIPHTGSP